MKLQWFWNASYEDLMGVVGQWLAGKSSLTVVHLDLRPVADPSSGRTTWYWTLIYKE